MPAKTGSSHSFAAFTTMIVGAVISKYVWNAVPPFADVSAAAGELLLRVTGVSYGPRFVGGLIIATGLAFVWGVLYHMRHV